LRIFEERKINFQRFSHGGVNESYSFSVRLEALTAAMMIIMFFWVLAPCRLAGR
jgi:hypothetical protein